MADLEAIIIKKLLSDPDNSLEFYKSLKPKFFSRDYTHLFSSISKFFEAKNKLPTTSEMQLYTRDNKLADSVKALELLSIPEDITLDIACEALVNEYTQNETLAELENFVDKIAVLSSDEIKRGLADISLHIEEKTNSSEEIFYMDDIITFDPLELSSRIPLGINNSFDIHTGGCLPSELILIGGFRGSGKSIVSTNIVNNQYLQGNVSVLFTIEMRAHQVFHRFLSMLSGVSHSKIRKNNLEELDIRNLAKARASMFEGSEDLLEDFYSQKSLDYSLFERKLLSAHKIRSDNQVIFVDNAALTLADIDLTLKNLKSKYGDKFKVAVVDYLNQIQVSDQYDWKVQIELAKRLKDLADKHDIVMISPYQTDKDGVAKFSKGILIPPDIAMTLNACEDHIKFKTEKIRDSGYSEFCSPINWDTLCISAEDYVVPAEKELQEDNF